MGRPQCLSSSIVKVGESIASEGKGDYLYVEGRVLNLEGTPIPGTVIDTWEADSYGKMLVRHTMSSAQPFSRLLRHTI